MTIAYVLTVLYMAVPAYVANMMPVVVARFKMCESLATPVHIRLLGANKTWRGLLVGIVAGVVVALVQWLVWMPYVSSIGVALAFGLLAGAGALIGDMVESMVKRALGIGSGRPFIPFDQIDYIIGMLLFTLPVYLWSYTDMGILLVFVLVANPVTNVVAYLIGVKKTFW